MAFDRTKFKQDTKGIGAPPPLDQADTTLLESAAPPAPPKAQEVVRAAAQVAPAPAPVAPRVGNSGNKMKKGRYVRADGVDMEQMSLNVPHAIAREFRIEAAVQGIGLGDLFIRCYEAYKLGKA